MSDVDLEQLNDMQLDVLKEIGNIGAGNATTALSTMLNVKMDMSVPNVALIQFKVMHKASGWNNTKITDSSISKILKAKPVRNIPSP